MKNIRILIVATTLFSFVWQGSFGQQKAEEIAVKGLNEVDIQKDIAQDEFRYRIGSTIQVNQSLFEASQTNSNELEFTIEITAKNAKAIALYFNEFLIPEGGTLWLYNASKTQKEGPYNSLSNSDGGSFALPYIVGDKVILKYNQGTAAELPKLKLREIGYFYRGIPEFQKSSRDFGDSESCQVNVNCSEGDNYKDQRDATVRILVKDGSGLFWCTGTLMNNTDGGCTPYILSASHCAEQSTSSDFNDFIFYFNYQGAGCENPVSELAVNFEELTGCQKIAQSATPGDADSDYLLLELNDTIPAAWNVFYSGWDATSTARGVGGGVGIHHPSGDIKKVSTYKNAMTLDSWGGVKQNTHLLVNWVLTANGFGVTEGGSSGSGIFDLQGLLLGTLTGGASVCGQPSSAFDYYGRMNYHWDRDGTAADRRIDVWLDPNQTGMLRLAGTRRPCIAQPASVNEVLSKQNLFSFYPNPSNGLVNFEFETPQVQLNVFDELGKLVISKNISQNQQLQLNLKQGMYIVEAIAVDGIDRKSLIISE